MKKFYKTIIFTDAYLMDAFRYKDLFQLVPISYASNAPLSIYAKHCPCFLEYVADEIEECNPNEESLKKLEVDEGVIKLARRIPNQSRVINEILLLLNSLTNFHFFVYGSNTGIWGIRCPLKDVETLSDEKKHEFNHQVSHWIMPVYMYNNCAKDLKIDCFTECQSYCKVEKDSRLYYTHNPNIENNSQIKLPPYLDVCFDKFYQLPSEMQRRVKQCMGLLKDGIDLFNIKRSLSVLSIISSIEGMALLDYELYGKAKNLSPSARFKRYLKLYVAGLSEDKYGQYYDRRSCITHEGRQFLIDEDLYGDVSIHEQERFLGLEILQCARLALYNWLRVDKTEHVGSVSRHY